MRREGGRKRCGRGQRQGWGRRSDARGACDFRLSLDVSNLGSQLRQPLVHGHAATSLFVTPRLCRDKRQQKHVDQTGDHDASSARLPLQ